MSLDELIERIERIQDELEMLRGAIEILRNSEGER